MAPPSSSSSPPDRSDAKTDSTSKGLRPDTNNGTSSASSRAVPRSPSGLTLSRPKSMLSPARPSPSTASISSTHRPPSIMSASPSSRSIVDRSQAGGSNAASGSTPNQAGGLGVGSNALHATSSAMGRLKRVASNASIASSMRLRLTSTDQKATAQRQSEVAKVPRTDVGKGEADGHEASSQAPDMDAAGGGGMSNSTQLPATDTMQDGGAQDANHKADQEEPQSFTKRQLDASQDTQQKKQARRRTWFGFGGLTDEQGDSSAVATHDASGSSKGDQAMGSASASVAAEENDNTRHGGVVRSKDDHDGQDTIKASRLDDATYGTVKSWLPWRMPAGGEQDSVNDSQASDAVASYTDNVRRYISWGTPGSAPSTSSPGTGWGWSGWRTASIPAQHAGATSDPKPLHSGQTSAKAQTTDQRKAENEGTVAVQLDTRQVSKHNATASDATPQTSTAASSPAQGSLLYRWMPSWGQSSTNGANSNDEGASTPSQDRSHLPIKTAPGPPTPAEKYKAEALAHLGAKDAVLNNATRSTWINYFSSRSAAARARMTDTDIDEPEVMKITDAPASTTASKPDGTASRTGTSTPVSHSGPPPVGTRSEDQNGSKKVEAINSNADPAPPISRPATPLTKEKDRARQVTTAAAGANAAIDGKKAKPAKIAKTVAPNLLLPSFDDTFQAAPRSILPKKGVWEKTMSLLFNTDSSASQTPKVGGLASSSDPNGKIGEAQARLPRLWSTMGEKDKTASRGCKGIRKVTVIGIHGWFSQGPIRNIFGEPTGTSKKFANMMTAAVKHHFAQAGHTLADEQITSIALEAHGQVSERVDKSFAALLSNPEWISDLLSSDAIFVAAHSQGSIVATHLLARLVEQRHLDPRHSRIVLLCMCGIHNGPFAHLRGSISSYYMSTFESPAAKELFEFQNGMSPVSCLYAASLRIVAAAGIKLVYIASLDDQVVPLYSALHSAASHPSILRAIFCDGAAFPRVDFLTNLLSFCVNVRNAGLGDHHLVTLLSSSVAGSLYGGLGHSLIYDEPEVYGLAVRYLMEVTSPASYPTARPGQPVAQTSVALSPGASLLPPGIPALQLDDDFTVARNQTWNNNPYALPWSLRGLMEDDNVRRYFSHHIDKLVRDYLEWQPSTKTLKDVQFRLEPMRLVASPSQRASTSRSPSGTTTPSNSKL